MIVHFLLALVAATAQPIVTLSTGGGPPGSDRFTVELLASCSLHVTKESLPMTANGMTKRILEKRLSGGDRDEIVRLATTADDFAVGCNGVVDGTKASLAVRGIERSCIGASNWPAGARTKRLLRAINRHLTEPMRVY